MLGLGRWFPTFFSLRKWGWSLDVRTPSKQKERRCEMAQDVGKPWVSNKLCYFLGKPVSAFWLQFRRKGSGNWELPNMI